MSSSVISYYVDPDVLFLPQGLSHRARYNFPMALPSPQRLQTISCYLADKNFHRNLVAPSAIESHLVPCTLDIHL